MISGGGGRGAEGRKINIRAESMFKAVMPSQSLLDKKMSEMLHLNIFPGFMSLGCLGCLPQLTDLLRTFHKLGLIYDLLGRAAPFPPPPASCKRACTAIVCNFCDVQNAVQQWIYEASW